jgi:hypothetical protein
LHRGQGREVGMHSLLVSCQRNLRHSIAENGNFLHPEEGREAGICRMFAFILPEKTETL